MSKPKFLWHGSTRKLSVLKPKQAIDTSGDPESNLVGVYATGNKKLAICFGLISKKHVYFGEYKKNKFVGRVIIKGDVRKGKHFYLHKLSSKGFKERPKGSGQWVYLKEVKPLEIIKLRVDDYKHLCRKATKKDVEYYHSIVGKFSK